MNIPAAARYDYVSSKATAFLEENLVETLPLDILNLIDENRWGLMTYQQLAATNDCSFHDVLTASGSDDGFTVYNGRNYTIAFNERRSRGRIRFTLAHEIGHIFLKHFIDFDELVIARGAMSSGQYKVLENEANAFARNILSPLCTMLIKKWSTTQIMDICQITFDAATTRLDFLRKDLYWAGFTRALQYQEAVMEDAILELKYSNQCFICGHNSSPNSFVYCPICGDKKERDNMYHFEIDVMVYDDGIDLLPDGRAGSCPRCGCPTNWEGEFCSICGFCLVNRCTEGNYEDFITGEKCNHDNSFAAGYVRYCNFCGSPMTFLKAGALPEWQDAKAIISLAKSREISLKEAAEIFREQQFQQQLEIGYDIPY